MNLSTMQFHYDVAFVYIAIMLIVDIWYEDGYQKYGSLYTNAHVLKVIFTGVFVGFLPTWTGTSSLANALMSVVPMSIHTGTRLWLDWYVGRKAAHYLRKGLSR